MGRLTQRPMTGGYQRSTPLRATMQQSQIARSAHRLDIPRSADLIQKRPADHILFVMCIQYSSWKEVMIDIDIIVLPTQPTPGLALHEVPIPERRVRECSQKHNAGTRGMKPVFVSFSRLVMRKELKEPAFRTRPADSRISLISQLGLCAPRDTEPNRTANMRNTVDATYFQD